MKTAVIYARYSSDSQTEQSIEGQVRVCKEYAERNDILILDQYIDRAMTGTNDNRPDFQRMIKDSSNKKWDYVLVYKLDRFSRNKYETTIHKHTLSLNGVKVLSAMENIPDSPEGIILESLLEGMNQYYSAELAQKVKRGMNETRQKGNFTGGTIIYGYKVENHKVKINEEEAEVVRYIFKQYSLGVYVKDIIKALNEKQIYHRNKPFAKNTIYNMLKNEKYSGIYRFRSEVFENMYPAIINHNIYDKVRRKIELNKYGKRSINVTYLLKQKLTCGYCGKSINAECGTTKKGKRIYYYKCLGRKHNLGCKKESIRKEELEEFIIDILIKKLKNKEFIQSMVDSVYNLQENLLNNNIKLQMILKEKEQKQKSIDNIVKAIENGIISTSTNNRLNELENELEILNKQILIEESNKTTKIEKETIFKYYVDALKLNPQMLINYLIKQIVIYDDKIKIEFNTPIKESPENNQGFLFYSDSLSMSKSIVNIEMYKLKKPIGIEMFV